MYAITLLGNRWLIGAMLLGIALWVVRTGRCRTPLGVMVAAFVFNPVLEALLKGLVGRQRPELAQLVSGDGPAFPSGHVLATVGFYGVLAVVAWRSTTKRGFAIAGLVGAATVITLVGFSRIYLGVHWMTDVVGAFLVGTVFVLAAAYFLRGHNLGPSISCWLSVFGSTVTGVALAEDMSKGLVDRFRSLPMSRSAVLAGRTTGDLIRNLFVVGLITIVASLIGFRFHAGIPKAALALLLAAFFGFSFSWISATIGLAVRDVESAQAAGFVWVFPLVFASSTFVPVITMPGWLQAFAEVNPITLTVDSIRALVLGGPVLTHLWKSVAWMAGILAVFIPLAVGRYRKAV